MRPRLARAFYFCVTFDLIQSTVPSFCTSFDSEQADATVAFVERVAASEHTTLAGIYGHAGQSYHAASLEEVIAIAKEEFAEVSRVAARVGTSPAWL